MKEIILAILLFIIMPLTLWGIAEILISIISMDFIINLAYIGIAVCGIYALKNELVHDYQSKN